MHFCHEELIALLSALPLVGFAVHYARCWFCGRIRPHKHEETIR